MAAKKERRMVNDPIHGFIELSDLLEELINTPEVQRLAWIRQTGLTSLVYPGANHTRLEHSLGVAFVAGQIAEHLGLSQKEKDLIQAVGLLHDIGHTPMSHALEPMLKVDHMDLTAAMVLGKTKIPVDGTGEIPSILKKHGLNPEDVAAIITESYRKKPYLQDIMHGTLDADQLDYLIRDAHYTGVSYGVIDIDRIIKTMTIVCKKICVSEKSVDTVEEALIARDHMYAAVYLHHTTRIAEMMLLRAAQSVSEKLRNFWYWTDFELLERLRTASPYAKEMTERLIYRNLFKRTFELRPDQIGVKEKARLEEFARHGEDWVERQIAKETGLEKKYLIVDMPLETLKVTEPRIKELGVRILRKDGSVVDVCDISPIARALLEQQPVHSVFSVYVPEEWRGIVGKAVKKMF
jgi:hypothetical protein